MRRSFGLWLPVVVLGAFSYPLSAEVLEELLVTSARAPRPAMELIGNSARLDAEAIRITHHQHVHELGVRLPGTWISRGSGQEHLTAIRSPVLTGPGSCGAFLMLEDGIPVRPTGFCNVNQLFEVVTESAQATEVVRGPANALYGSNGLHGTINFLLPQPRLETTGDATLESGPDDFWRARVNATGALGGTALSGGALADTYDGFRDDSGYDQFKAYGRARHDLSAGSLVLGISGSTLDQETAGFIFGEDVYKDETLRTTNPNPEAYRDASSLRMFARYLPFEGSRWENYEFTGWLRSSDMDFLQHFLPGQPVEENGQLSAGLSLMNNREISLGLLTMGIDLEVADGELEEFQESTIEDGSDFLIETRPAGAHYDYDVLSLGAGAYAQLEMPLGAEWTAQAGLRLEYLYYDYENNLLDGNTRDDGTECGFGGCLFTRPGDRSDSFVDLAPNVGLSWRPRDDTQFFATLARGFRAPQATELYRLQSGQEVADLDSETIDSLEIGARWMNEWLYTEAAVFGMRKENYIFRDAEGFNVSDGESRHLGLEASAQLELTGGFYGSVAGTWAEHTYRFDRDASRGETISKGNDVDTSPNTLGSLQAGWRDDRLSLEAEWVHQGSYYLDAANTAKYEGHDLLHLRASWQLTPAWRLGIRLNNVTDELIADRADFAFGNYRYLPGRDRELFVEIGWQQP